jgi:hypothetical protein
MGPPRFIDPAWAYGNEYAAAVEVSADRVLADDEIRERIKGMRVAVWIEQIRMRSGVEV